MLYYLTRGNVTGLLWFLVIPESLWGIIQLYGYWLYRMEGRLKPGSHVSFKEGAEILSAPSLSAIESKKSYAALPGLEIF